MENGNYDDSLFQPEKREGDGFLFLTLVLVCIGGLVVVMVSAMIGAL